MKTRKPAAARAVRKARAAASSSKCQWFARCDRPATTTTPHPVLGDVPTCQRCHNFATK